MESLTRALMVHNMRAPFSNKNKISGKDRNSNVINNGTTKNLETRDHDQAKRRVQK